MLSSITWGTWDQLHWRGEYIKYSEGSYLDCGESTHDETTPGAEYTALHRRRLIQQVPGAHSSSWRHRPTGKKGSQSPLFQRLLEKLVRQAPSVIPRYGLPRHGLTRASSFQSLPQPCLPAAGGLDESRAQYKTAQVQNLLEAVCSLVEVLLRRRRGKRNKQSGKPHEALVHVVEFCGGAGYIAIPLAALYSSDEVRVTLLDMKTHSLVIAQDRIKEAGLKNIEIRRERLEEFQFKGTGKPAADSFDIGVALHACGAASDIAQELCVTAGAAYVMAPCCIGKIRSSRRPGITRRAKGGARSRTLSEFRRQQMSAYRAILDAADEPASKYDDAEEEDEVAEDNGGEEYEDGEWKTANHSIVAEAGEKNLPTDPSTVVYPRSVAIRSVLSAPEWATIARAADFGHREMKEYDEEQRKRRMAKSFIEADRQLFASEAGYDTLLSIMLPRTATPKNDVLVGWPRQWAGVSAHAEDEVSGGHIIGFNNEIQNALMTMVAPDPPAVRNDSTIEQPQKNMEKAIKLLEKQLFG